MRKQYVESWDASNQIDASPQLQTSVHKQACLGILTKKSTSHSHLRHLRQDPLAVDPPDCTEDQAGAVGLLARCLVLDGELGELGHCAALLFGVVPLEDFGGALQTDFALSTGLVDRFLVLVEVVFVVIDPDSVFW